MTKLTSILKCWLCFLKFGHQHSSYNIPSWKLIFRNDFSFRSIKCLQTLCFPCFLAREKGVENFKNENAKRSYAWYFHRTRFPKTDDEKNKWQVSLIVSFPIFRKILLNTKISDKKKCKQRIHYQNKYSTLENLIICDSALFDQNSELIFR